VPKPVVFTPPSSNVAALLRSREPKETLVDAAAKPIFVDEVPARASRRAASEDTSSNVSALLRSQAAATAGFDPGYPSRGDYEPPADEPDEFTAVLDEADDGADIPPVKTKRRLSDILLLVLAVMLIAGGATYGIVATIQSHNVQTMVDLEGNHVAPDDNSMFDPNVAKQMDAKDDTGQRFIIDSVNLDVPLGEVNEVGGVINPPGFTSAYLIRNKSVSLDKADTGTVYVAAHSLRSPGKAPGNYVINIAAGNITVPYGATIQVGDRTYVMTSSEIVAKTDLGDDSKLWANTPGMLVFITCLQYDDPSKYKNTGGHSPTNAVIIGQLVS